MVRKTTKSSMIGDVSRNQSLRLDSLDIRIISLLMSGKTNKQIAHEEKVPLSTIQRRTRRLYEKNTIRGLVEPNYKQLGYSKGVIHIYINNVDAIEVSEKLAQIPGVISVSIHIGNSDIVADIVYRTSEEILQLIARCKRIEGVTKAVWSEEVYRITSGSKPNWI